MRDLFPRIDEVLSLSKERAKDYPYANVSDRLNQPDQATSVASLLDAYATIQRSVFVDSHAQLAYAIEKCGGALKHGGHVYYVSDDVTIGIPLFVRPLLRRQNLNERNYLQPYRHNTICLDCSLY